MPQGKITRERYILYSKDIKNNKWVEHEKYPSIITISKKINVSLMTAHNIYNNKAKKYNLFYKIKKITDE